MRKKDYKIIVCILLSIMCVTMLSGCKKDVEESYIPSENDRAVYYKDASGYGITARYVEIEEEDVQAQIKHILNSMLIAPQGLESALNEETIPMDYKYDSGVATFYFSAAYNQLPISQEILLRGAIVKTMVGLDEIKAVQFYILDQPLVDKSGEVVGLMDGDSFTDSVNKKIVSITVPLYFSDESGKWLVQEEREIMYPADENPAGYIVNSLVDGPNDKEHYPVLNSSLDIQSVNVSDGVCYLYFNDGFLANSLNVANEIPIYALVNTLSELADISRVQFVIGGSSDKVFRNEISLEKPFSSKLDLILKQE